MKTNNMNTQKRGRKPGIKTTPDHLRRKSRTLTMDDARWLKFKELGGAKWLSLAIDAATPPSLD